MGRRLPAWFRLLMVLLVGATTTAFLPMCSSFPAYRWLDSLGTVIADYAYPSVREHNEAWSRPSEEPRGLWLVQLTDEMGDQLLKHSKLRATIEVGAYSAIGATAALLLWVLLARGRASPPDGLTRCGRCSHILKGLTVPRCPECGLVI